MEAVGVSFKKGKFYYRNFSTVLIYLQIFFVIFYRSFLSLGVSNSISYITDLINIILFVKLFDIRKRTIKTGAYIIILLYTTLYLFGFLASITYGFKLPLYIWSMRNYLRMIVFFLACIKYLSISDIDKICHILSCLLLPETLIVIIQYYILGIRADYLGGFFGTIMGANLYVNIYLLIIFTFSITRYINKELKFSRLIFNSFLCIVIATLSELKFVFIEMIIVSILVVLFKKNSLKYLGKYIMIAIGGIALLATFLPIIYKLYPDFENFLRLDFIFAVHEQGYSMSGDLDRLSALPIITKSIFNNNLFKMIFGIGLGNAEYSSISMLSSEFYNTYYYLHYTWFSDAIMYIEAGIIGLVLYASTFFVVFWKAVYIRKKNGVRDSHMLLAIIIAIMCIVLAIYNQTLRTEIGYLIYFVLAIPFIQQKYSR